MDLRCEPGKGKCCIYLPGVPQTERKGRKDRRESARRTGLRIPGPVQKTGMDDVHLVVHNGILAQWSSICLLNKGLPVRVRQMHQSQRVYGFRKENQLIVLQYEHMGRPQADL